MINILIPCAGLGKRFSDVGYKLPKPLIPIGNKTMIERVVESLGINGNYIFCCLKEHQKFGIIDILTKIKPNCSIVWINSLTEGALSTCLLAEYYINSSDPLIICNSDQIMEFDRVKFLGNTLYYDGCILTFPANDPKWSYILTDSKGRIATVVEKEVISTQANCGIYSWKRGTDFVYSAKEIIRRNIRSKGEYYIAPSYNILIANNAHIQAQKVENFFPCGTPEDLEKTIQVIAMQDFKKEGGLVFTRDIHA